MRTKKTSRSAAFLGSLLLMSLSACVPKSQYEDQQEELAQTQQKLQALEVTSVDCDPNLYVQMKEQLESLDLLTNELVTRNTELSKEVARLKVLEGSTSQENTSCKFRMDQLQLEHEARFERTRVTYEDLIRELRSEIERLKAEISAAKTKASKDSGTKSNSSKSKAAEKKK